MTPAERAMEIVRGHKEPPPIDTAQSAVITGWEAPSTAADASRLSGCWLV